MTPPRTLAEKKEMLATEYASLSETLVNVLSRKPAVWAEIRKSVKSDTSADRAWEGTEDGLIEMRTKLRMKAIEKELSATSSMLSVLEGEARNLF